MIQVTPSIAIDEGLIEESFVRASGPGGQNVQKVSSAVQLRFNAAAAELPEHVRARLPAVAGRRMTQDGVIVIVAQRFRDQLRNRADALERLLAILREAAHRDKPRRPTRATYGSQQRRLASKAKRGKVKSLRSGKPGDD
ncbi:alternative ribosome rescue aminoacyl-tRNA hydrolase ArfB [Bosea sp. TWI1241]|jgi:ribosome-associated protein|uniref:alternative ribosome rescue aminoacyl-tRNA hydrolase ArfB n=1 Tax=Bosea sp. TWI1241 TaxID=3148904 RepID=UPI0032085F47